MDEQDYLPAVVIFPAQPGWRVHYISRDDKPEDLEDFLHRPADMVIAWHSTVDAWTRPVVAGEQFGNHSEASCQSGELDRASDLEFGPDLLKLPPCIVKQRPAAVQ